MEYVVGPGPAYTAISHRYLVVDNYSSLYYHEEPLLLQKALSTTAKFLIDEGIELVYAPDTSGTVLAFAAIVLAGKPISLYPIPKVGAQTNRHAKTSDWNFPDKARAILLDDVIDSGAEMRRCLQYIGERDLPTPYTILSFYTYHYAIGDIPVLAVQEG